MLGKGHGWTWMIMDGYASDTEMVHHGPLFVVLVCGTMAHHQGPSPVMQSKIWPSASIYPE